MDRISRERRSWLMSRIGSRDTLPEKIVRSVAHKAGYRFRLHYKKLPGKPDLAFVARKKVIFVHGCYWHGHRCRKGGLAKSNRTFWKGKILANRARDRRSRIAIERLGWKVLTIWQCELRDICVVRARLVDFLG